MARVSKAAKQKELVKSLFKTTLNALIDYNSSINEFINSDLYTQITSDILSNEEAEEIIKTCLIDKGVDPSLVLNDNDDSMDILSDESDDELTKINNESSRIMNKIWNEYDNQDQWGENTPYYPENYVAPSGQSNIATIEIIHPIKGKESEQITHEMSRQEIKLLVDEYYDAQNRRKAYANKIRAVEQGYDVSSISHKTIIQMLYDNAVIEENNIKKILTAVVNNSEVGRWLVSIKGIGTVLSAGLLSSIEIYDSERNFLRKPSQVMSYAGLNDQNRPWLGREKATKIVNEIIGDSKEITDEHLAQIAIRTGWNFNTLAEKCLAKTKIKSKDGKTAHEIKVDSNGKSKRDKAELISTLSSIPYNKSLKTLLWKVGESFVKVSNRGSLYGLIYKTRYAYEIVKNEKGEYADQAAKILKEKKYDKSTKAYEYYSAGKLPPAHIIARSKRYAEKIFLQHLYEEICLVEGYQPYAPYITNKVDKNGLIHRGYIWPEVPFSREIKDRPGCWTDPSNITIDTITHILSDVSKA